MRLSVNKNSPLKVVRCCTDVVVIKDGLPIVTGRLEPALSHCPEQAYLNISGACVYNCKFCPVFKLNGAAKDRDEILQLVEEAKRTGQMRAVSLTSGVERSYEEEVERAVSMVRALREKYDLPICVSVYPADTSSEELLAAGATEIKYNVQTMDPEIFSRNCPGLSLQYVLRSLEKAVKVFGKNRVSSNFILGLGESDECVLAGVTRLAEMGVIPIFRPVSAHPLRRGDAEIERPSAERLLRLARASRRVLEDHGLRADLAETMCLACTGCDITPHKEI